MPPPSSVLSHPGDSQPLSSFLLFHVGSKILAPHRACEGRSFSPPSNGIVQDTGGFASCWCFAYNLQSMCLPRGPRTKKMALVTLPAER